MDVTNTTRFLLHCIVTRVSRLVAKKGQGNFEGRALGREVKVVRGEQFTVLM